MDSDDTLSTASSSYGLGRSESPSAVPLPSSPLKAPTSLFSETLVSQRTRPSPVTILFQEKCFLHRYIRDKDTSGIVERPERLKAVALGLAAGVARLEQELSINPTELQRATVPSKISQPEELARAMSQMTIEEPVPSSIPSFCRIIHSSATLDLTTHPALRFVHAEDEPSTSEGTDYLFKLRKMAAESESKVKSGLPEIPDNLPKGDLYLCPESYDAICGAAATVCEAVDLVCSGRASGESKSSVQGPSIPSESGATLQDFSKNASDDRAFVVIRPPGHHCGEDTPSGFCFINNVAIGAAHAYLEHNIDRVVILDIDLHHGNGTQKIAWAINQETHRRELEGHPSAKPGLKVFYGSLHDVLSYPCEDGDPELIRDASVSLHDAHGQFIENIHLHPYTSEQEFHENLYDGLYSQLLFKARRFIEVTSASPQKTLFFISCGFDACEHEYSSMSRHGRKVPVSFYERFAADVCRMANLYANGRVISVLEGGYSDRALTSGALAHLSGLVLSGRVGQAEWDWTDRGDWWNVKNLIKLENAVKKNRKVGPNPRSRTTVNNKAQDSAESWIIRTLEVFALLDRSPSTRQRTPAPVPQSSRTLRDRSKKTGQVQVPSDPDLAEPHTGAAIRSKPRRSLPSKPSPKAADGGYKPISTSSGPRKSVSKSAQSTPNSKARDAPLEVAGGLTGANAPKSRRKSAQGVAGSAQPNPMAFKGTPDPPIPSLPVLQGQTQNMVTKYEAQVPFDVRSPMTPAAGGGDTTREVASQIEPNPLKIKIKMPPRPPPSSSSDNI